jgi:hypothetical protein
LPLSSPLTVGAGAVSGVEVVAFPTEMAAGAMAAGAMSGGSAMDLLMIRRLTDAALARLISQRAAQLLMVRGEGRGSGCVALCRGPLPFPGLSLPLLWRSNLAGGH